MFCWEGFSCELRWSGLSSVNWLADVGHFIQLSYFAVPGTALFKTERGRYRTLHQREECKDGKERNAISQRLVHDLR